MSKNKTLIIILIVIIALILIAGIILYQVSIQKTASSNNQSQKEVSSVSQSVESDQDLPVNFSETGKITNWDAKTETASKDWTFVYEMPGKPALNLKLEFNKKSICNIGRGDKPCDLNDLTIGSTAKIEGNSNNQKLVVSHLTMIAIVP